MPVTKHIVAVNGCIKNKDGKVLMKRHPDRSWEFPGGKVEEDEHLMEVLKQGVYVYVKTVY